MYFGDAKLKMRFSFEQQGLLSLVKYRSSALYLLFFLILFGFISLHKGQEVAFDLRNYHYYDGFAFWNHRYAMDTAVGGVQGYLNPLLDALNYWLIEHLHGPRLISFSFGMLCGLNAFFLWKSCRLLLKETPGAQVLNVGLALLIGLTSQMFIFLVGSAMNDAQSAVFVMAFFCCLLSALQVEQASRQMILFLLAGVLLGAGTGLKLTNAVYALATFFALSALPRLFNTKIKMLFFVFLGVLLGFLWVNGWWMWHLYKAFGNPLFPYYNDVFHSPYFINTSARDPRFYAHSLWQAIAFPYHLSVANTLQTVFPARDGRFALLFTLFAYALLRKRLSRLQEKWLFTFVFFFVAYFIWVFQFGILRYALPLQLLSGPLIVFLLHQLIFRARTFALLLVAALLWATTLYPRDYDHQPFGGEYLWANVPSLLEPALVIFTGLGQSYLAPFFPHSTHFVNPAFPKLADPVIAAYTRPIYVVVGPDTQNLKYAVQEKDCKTIVTSVHYAAGVNQICPLIK